MGSGAGINSRRYAEALEQKDNIYDKFTRFFNQFDVWITPVSADKAFKHQNAGKPFNINGKKVPYTKAFVPLIFHLLLLGIQSLSFQQVLQKAYYLQVFKFMLKSGMIINYFRSQRNWKHLPMGFKYQKCLRHLIDCIINNYRSSL